MFGGCGCKPVLKGFGQTSGEFYHAMAVMTKSGMALHDGETHIQQNSWGKDWELGNPFCFLTEFDSWFAYSRAIHADGKSHYEASVDALRGSCFGYHEFYRRLNH